MFEGLPRGHYRALLVDPPWRFRTWSEANQTRSISRHYELMSLQQIAELPVKELAAPDAVLFLWMSWPQLLDAIAVIEAWEFEYKTCAFAWIKAHANQLELFKDDLVDQMGLGYWTRANSEVCLLATRGEPKRMAADVRQAIIEPRREHSRKPDCVYERIERLVEGPYLDLFSRTDRSGWTCWGDQKGMFRDTMPSRF